MTIRKFILEVADDGSERVKSEIEKLEREWGIEEIEAQQTEMRDATEEESQSVKNYIKSISKPTGLNFDEAYEEFEELDFIAPHKRLSVNLMVQPTDAVSRQDVDAYIAKLMSGYLYDEERTRLEEFSAYLWDLPSVTPQRSKGKWLDDCGGVKCSCCGYYIDDYYYCKNYCTNCGAELEEA
jgi:hypothetical protein